MDSEKIPRIWGGGQLLGFSGIDGATAFKNGLCLRTVTDSFDLEILNRDLPHGDCLIRYTGPAPLKTALTGDFFRLDCGDTFSEGVFADCCNFLLEGSFELHLSDCYESCARGNKFLVAPRGLLEEKYLDCSMEQFISERAVFLENAHLPAGISRNSRRAAVKALSQLKTQIYAPEGIIRHYWSTPDRWPHKKMWLWDSVFHALGMRHYDPRMAKDMISAMFDLQQSDGRIPHSGTPEGASQAVTQPPVLSLAMRLIDAVDPDPRWIRSLAGKLEQYIFWLMANRDSDGAGLLEWHISGQPDCRSGESGMDNSPRFDGAIQLDAPDFNAYLAFECESLAMFLPEKRDFWLGHHDRICRLMRQRLWSEEKGIFVDYDVTAGKQSDVLASSGFLPLYCGGATAEQAARMAAHLTDPETFGTPLRIPSIARNNTAAYRKDMWRGPVWTNVNYMICLGLQRYGYDGLARAIMTETMREQEKWYLECGTFFEFYDDRKEAAPRELERKGKAPGGLFHPFHQVFHDYGWSGTLYLEMINRAEWN